MTKLAREVRKTILDIVNRASAAHIASSLSAVEIMNAIFRSVDVKKIENHAPDRDRVILSKGHAAAVLYAVMYHFGLLSKKDIDTYLQNGSLLGGHASHFIPRIEHSTGALGHGLSVGTGCAMGLKAQGFESRVFVVLGDGELHEGSNWEAMIFAGHRKISNLCVIVDRNGLAQMKKPLAEFCDVDPIAPKFESFNFHTVVIPDGHDEDVIFAAIAATRNVGKPVAIICKTVKGRGISFMENEVIWHYRTPKGEDYEKAKAELEAQS